MTNKSAIIRSAVFGVLLGLGIGQAAAELKLQASAQPALAAPPAIRAGLPSELLQRRPDLAQSLAQLHAATLVRVCARRSFTVTL